MQAITPDLVALLKAHFEAGASGFRGRVTVGTGLAAVTLYPSRISIDKSLRMQADQADFTVPNEALPLGWGSETLVPTGSQVFIDQWYGDAANAVRTFTGLLDKGQDHRDVLTTTLTCRDRMALLIDETFSASAPQGAAEDGAVRTPANGVYLNLEVSAIVADILDRVGWPSADRAIAATSYVLAEYVIADGSSYADAIIGADKLTGVTGYDAWSDEAGIFHFAPTPASDTVSVDAVPVYTFRSGEDILALDDTSDLYDTKTRVKVRGPMTTLKDAWTEIWTTDAFSLPVGLWYDPTDSANLRVLDRGTKKLYTLRQSDRSVLSSVYLGAVVGHPLGLSGDPADASVYWVLDAPWRTTGVTSGNIVRKFRKSDNVQLASFAIPDGRWSAIKVSSALVWLTNLDTDRFYSRSKTTLAAVADYSHTYGGVVQLNPTGLMIDGTRLHLFWANGGTTARFLECEESAPTVIVKVVVTAGTNLHGGEMDTTTHTECYGDSDSLGLVAKFTLYEALTNEVAVEVVDTALEDELGALAGLEPRVHDTHPGDPAHAWEARRETVSISVVTNLAQATATARACLERIARRRRVVEVGIVGNPALQKTDLVRVEDPISGLALNLIIDTFRSEMAADGTYVGTLALTHGGLAQGSSQAPVETPLPDGSWTQGNFPHAVRQGGTTFVGYADSSGDIRVSSIDADGTVVTSTLHSFGVVDSHAGPALMIRQSDARLIAVYSAHDGTALYQRVSTNPLDVSAWGAERDIGGTYLHSADYTYPSLCQLSADGSIHLFYRMAIFGPDTAHLMWAESADGGSTWVLGTAGPALYVNPGQYSYWQVDTNWVDRIDIVVSDADAYGLGLTPGQAASLYHFYAQTGTGWHKSDGTALGVGFPFAPSDLTPVYDGSVAGQGSRPWDIAFDGATIAIAHEIVPADPGHHHWQWSSYAGASWSTHEVCDAGVPDVAAANWSGGAALRRDDATIMYACRRFGSGAWEVHRFATADGGSTFADSAVTAESGDQDNVYPSAIIGSSGLPRLVWMRGVYNGTTSFTTAIAVGAGPA